MARLQSTSRVWTSSLPALRRQSVSGITHPTAIANTAGAFELSSHFRAGSLHLANGNNITGWVDEVNGMHTIAQASSYPTFATNVVNGHPAVSFPGTAGYFAGNVSKPIVAGTLFAVIKSSEATFSTYRAPISGTANTANDQGMVCNSGSAGFLVTTGYTYYVNGGSGTTSGTLTDPTQWNIVICTLTPVTYSGIQIGRDRTTASRVWYGYIAEAGSFRTTLNAANLALLASYLNNKYRVY